MLEALKKAGIDESTAQLVVDKFPELIRDKYVPVSRINELREEIKGLNSQISERDTQLKKLKDSAGDNEELKKKIENLQSENKTAKENYEKQIADIKFNSALDNALIKSNAHDTELVKVKLNRDGLKLNDDGVLEGLDEQLEEVKKSCGYLFKSENEKSTVIDGIKPAESGGSQTESDPFLQGFNV